ncbi:hypothetical protein HAHI6034_10840 [Hathewaya histolytica]
MALDRLVFIVLIFPSAVLLKLLKSCLSIFIFKASSKAFNCNFCSFISFVFSSVVIFCVLSSISKVLSPTLILVPLICVVAPLILTITSLIFSLLPAIFALSATLELSIAPSSRTLPLILLAFILSAVKFFTVITAASITPAVSLVALRELI